MDSLFFRRLLRLTSIAIKRASLLNLFSFHDSFATVPLAKFFFSIIHF